MGSSPRRTQLRCISRLRWIKGCQGLGRTGTPWTWLHTELQGFAGSRALTASTRASEHRRESVSFIMKRVFSSFASLEEAGLHLSNRMVRCSTALCPGWDAGTPQGCLCGAHPRSWLPQLLLGSLRIAPSHLSVHSSLQPSAAEGEDLGWAPHP